MHCAATLKASGPAFEDSLLLEEALLGDATRGVAWLVDGGRATGELLPHAPTIPAPRATPAARRCTRVLLRDQMGRSRDEAQQT